ncbi:major capsid protein [Vibrio cionasavignyae]|uniref:major capsid protein n=1 Tax=Vibrio cionasavignyae TaxID=2910252 RepID=UPI003D116229
MNINKKVFGSVAMLASAFVAPSAFAAIDVTGATASITDGVTAVGVIGGAMIVITVLKRVWSKIGG